MPSFANARFLRILRPVVQPERPWVWPGVEDTLAPGCPAGEYDAFENERLLNAAAEALKVETAVVPTALRGKRATRAKKAKRAVAKKHRQPAQEPHSSEDGQAHRHAQLDRYRGAVDREHDRLREGDGRETRQERDGQSWA